MNEHLKPKIRCKFDKLVSISDLRTHPRNRNSHPKEQVEHLAKILNYQGFRYPIKVSLLSGFITSGHGRLLAAKLNGWNEVPVDFQEYDSEEQEYADVVADNAIAAWAELQIEDIRIDVDQVFPELDHTYLGIEDFDKQESDKESKYTPKVESPIYKITGEKPTVNQLFDYKKTEQLLDQISKSKAPDEVKQFLFAAAHRHVVFNYHLIAEFYAHADKETQELMEQSALVIIDFNKAIELGFVKLNSDLAKAYTNE